VHAIALAFCVLVLTASGGESAAAKFSRPFGPTSPWNVRLAPNEPLDPASPAMVADLMRQLHSYGAWINTTSYSVPIYTVPKDQHRVHVKLDVPGRHHAWNNAMFTNTRDAAALQRQLNRVPIPSRARPAHGTDLTLLIWQPSTDTAWEMWQARKAPRERLPWNDPTPGWHAVWGARVKNVSKGTGVLPAPFGASASGLALFGGLMRIPELGRGRIEHAVGLAIPQPRGGKYVKPATRTDGRHPTLIPEGTRFRLDPALDLRTLDLPPVTRMIAEAAQRYGLIVRDTAGAVVVYGEDPTPTGRNPYPHLFRGLSPDQLMARFPWDRLRALRPPQ
jgi:hypothetical protein